MQVTKMLVPASKYSIKCPYEMNPDGICVHNTANKASAMAEVSYMIGNNNSVSFHYAIDDYRIVQGIETNRNSWHSGDGRNGKGNRNKISIEICHSTNPDENIFLESEKLSAKFIATLLKEKGWGIDRVSKHQDYAKKYCPHKTLDLGWERFLNLIKTELGDVTISATPIKVVKIVETIQTWINNTYNFNIKVDNLFGQETKKALIKALQTELNKQNHSNLSVDGVFGNKSKNACINIKSGMSGNIVRIVQAILYCKGYNPNGIDGVFGANTTSATIKFQKNNGLSADGIVGKNTFEKLFK